MILYASEIINAKGLPCALANVSFYGDTHLLAECGRQRGRRGRRGGVDARGRRVENALWFHIEAVECLLLQMEFVLAVGLLRHYVRVFVLQAWMAAHVAGEGLGAALVRLCCGRIAVRMPPALFAAEFNKDHNTNGHQKECRNDAN